MPSQPPSHNSDGPDEAAVPVPTLLPESLGQLYHFYQVLVHNKKGTAVSPSHPNPNPYEQYAAESDSAATTPIVTVDQKSHSLSNSNSSISNPTIEPHHSNHNYNRQHHYSPSFFRRISPNATRRSRKDAHLRSASPESPESSTHRLPPFLSLLSLKRSLVGAVSCPVLPPFQLDMSLRSRHGVPATPRVISPSPTPSERRGTPSSSQDPYSGPVTRSARKRRATPQPVEELDGEDDEDVSPLPRRSRTRSRSPVESGRIRPLTSRRPSHSSSKRQDAKSDASVANGGGPSSNGHLAPPAPATPLGWNWRDFSRSPSPLGLIPIHRQWRTLVHKHEVPRKALHVSIGFVTLWLYVRGTQTASVPPYLMAALIPIATVDYLRMSYPAFNRVYVSVLGALMRESEYAGWNGVVFYLLGAWAVLYFFPKDVGIMGVLLLSWCDTAASTFGRAWGRYTPRIRKGKSLAGTLSAFLVGVATSWYFWGWLAPRTGPFPTDHLHPFMFNGVLKLPQVLAGALGLSEEQASISGALALGVMSLWSGLVAAGSEVVDLFGWDDNLTIPVLSGIGIWGFLKIFT